MKGKGKPKNKGRPPPIMHGQQKVDAWAMKKGKGVKR
jgi:hypothetical protein